jgi:CARDB
VFMNTEGESGKGSVTKATVNGLAVVGFGALILSGVFLAIYAASYVPQALSRLTGAVILSEEQPANPNTETETPTPTTPTVVTPAVEEDPDEEVTTPETPRTGGPLLVPQTPRITYTGPQLYGLPDLALVNVRAGYMRGSTFVEDNDVPSNRDAAVRFIVQNLGTNTVSDFRIKLEIENEDDAIGMGGLLYPNGTQLFTLRITNPEEGEELDIDIDVDYQNRIAETNERNNDKSITLDIAD